MTDLNKTPLATTLALSLALSFCVGTSVFAMQDNSTKPQDIKPAPYMPKGAIKLPNKPEATKQKLKIGETSLDGGAVTLDPIGAIIEGQDLDLLVNSLGEPDPSGVAATETDPQFAARLWGDNSRGDIIALLSRFETALGSYAVNKRAQAVLRAPVSLERPENDEGVSDLMQARLAAMKRMNDNEGYIALLSNLAADVNWQGLALHQTTAALAAGRTADACMTASNYDAMSDVDFWLKLKAFCSAVDGNRTAVDFNLAVLEETTEISATYYQLIDAILIEAEQSPNRAPDNFDNAPIVYDLPLSLLEVTMARVTGSKIESILFNNADPLAVPALLSQAGLSERATTLLVESALTNGWGDAKNLQQYLPKPEPEMDMEEVAVDPGDVDGTEIDTANVDNIVDTALSQTVDDSPVPASGEDFSEALVADGALTDITVEQPAVIIEEGPAPLNVIREAMRRGDNEVALATFRSARAMPVGQKPSADLALIETWPLMQVFESPTNSNTLSLTALTLWWQTKVDDEARFDKALTLFSTLEGLGYIVPDDAWIWLEDGPVTTGRRAISGAHWRRFLIAARSEAKAELYAALMPLFASSDPLDPTLAGSVLATLVANDETELAKDIGLEILVQAGL